MDRNRIMKSLKDHFAALNMNCNNEICKINSFLNASTTDEQYSEAKNLISKIGSIHQKKDVFEELTSQLLSYEQKVADEFLKSYKDHLLHSVYVYLLGRYLYDSYEMIKIKVNYKISKYKDNIPSRDEVDEFLFRWRLTSLFHDIAYPIEIAADLIQDTLDNTLLDLHTGKSTDTGSNKSHNTSTKKKYFGFNLLETNKSKIFEISGIPNVFPEQINTITIIAEEIAKDTIFNDQLAERQIQDLIEETLRVSLEKGYVEHGLFSANILLRQCAALYRGNSYFQNNYKNDFKFSIIKSVRDIALHTIMFRDNFAEGRQIEIEKAPLSWLLIFCDQIHQWDRNLLKKNGEHDNNEYSIEMEDDKIKVKIGEKTAEILEDTRKAINIDFVQEL